MRFRVCISSCLLLAVANVAIGDNQPRSGDNQPRTYVLKRQPEVLKIGDWYQIGVQSGPIRIAFKGILVKANEKWIVLGTQYRPNKPVQCTWILRQSGTIAAHAELTRDVPVIEREFPRSTEKVEVAVARGRDSSRRQVRVVGVKDSNLVLEDEKVPLNNVLWVKTVEPIREQRQFDQIANEVAKNENNAQEGDSNDENGTANTDR